jgi:hypothetical protein
MEPIARLSNALRGLGLVSAAAALSLAALRPVFFLYTDES